MNRWISSNPSRNRRFEIRSVCALGRTTFSRYPHPKPLSSGEGLAAEAALRACRPCRPLRASEFGQLHQNPYLYTDKTDI